MSPSDLASVGSFISGVAVLISLAFLYFQLRQVTEQVRQAERNQRATIAQVRAGRTMEVMLRTCDASMAEAFDKATTGDADLTVTQVQQFIVYALATFQNAEDTFHQHRGGLVEGGVYRTFLAGLGQNMARPAFRLAWRLSGRGYASPEFVEFFESLMAETPVRNASADLLAAWKTGYAELSATAVPPAL